MYLRVCVYMYVYTYGIFYSSKTGDTTAVHCEYFQYTHAYVHRLCIYIHPGGDVVRACLVRENGVYIKSRSR